MHRPFATPVGVSVIVIVGLHPFYLCVRLRKTHEPASPGDEAGLRRRVGHARMGAHATPFRAKFHVRKRSIPLGTFGLVAAARPLAPSGCDLSDACEQRSASTRPPSLRSTAAAYRGIRGACTRQTRGADPPPSPHQHGPEPGKAWHRDVRGRHRRTAAPPRPRHLLPAAPEVLPLRGLHRLLHARGGYRRNGSARASGAATRLCTP